MRLESRSRWLTDAQVRFDERLPVQVTQASTRRLPLQESHAETPPLAH
jgi:hypothetical protein